MTIARRRSMRWHATMMTPWEIAKSIMDSRLAVG